MKARFTRAFARVQIGLGVAIIAFGAALAILAVVVLWPEVAARQPLPPREDLLVRIALALTVFGAGVVVGTPFIVFGQLVLVFLEMRRRLVRIDRRLHRWQLSTRRDPPGTERLRPR